MIKVDKTTFDQVTMKAQGVDDDGRTIKLELTWAWAPDLSAYDLTNKRWLSRDEWQFIN